MRRPAIELESMMPGTLNRLASLISALLLSACVAAEREPSSVSESTSRLKAPLAEVHAFRDRGQSLYFEVLSSGCTSHESLQASTRRIDASTIEFSLLRIRPDYCRRRAFAYRVEYDKRELGIGNEVIRLVNPINEVALPGGIDYDEGAKPIDPASPSANPER